MRVQKRRVNSQDHTLAYLVGGKWRTRKQAVQLAKNGKIPNVSVTYYAKRNFILASDLPKNVPWKKEGYGKDDLVPIMTQITPVCVSTVLEGRCNGKDGCGLRNEDRDEEMPLESDIKFEIKRQKIIKRIKNKQLEFNMED